MAPFTAFKWGSRKVEVLSGYETVKDALVNYGDQFGEPSQVPIFKSLFEEKGITFSHGEIWKIMRRFSLTTLRNFGMSKRIIELQRNASISYRTSSQRKLFNMFPVWRFLLQCHKTVFRNGDELFSFIRMTFLDHLHKLDKNDPRSLTDVFLVRQQEEKDKSTEYFSEDSLVVLVTNPFVAGTETMASVLRWEILLMMRYPEVQKKISDEITEVVGSAQPEIAHGTQMPYTDAVNHEVQRFANILPTGLPHATTTNIIFKNYFIPKDILPSTSALFKQSPVTPSRSVLRSDRIEFLC
ncbi:cytochrome P450 2C5-like [Trichechus inunguis]